MRTFRLADLDDASRTGIAIIGAGVSGLYCAWRLLEADPGRRVTIVERLNRIGGRLDTDIVEIAGGRKVREEEGGMRFNYGMTELMTLNRALGLCDQIVPFPMASPDGTNRFFVRGRSFSTAAAAASDQMIWSHLYRLSPEETGFSPTDLVTNAFNAILRANGAQPEDGRPPEFWTRFREEFRWGGRPMKDWQVWGLLRTMGYSEECVDMLSQTIGFAGPFKSMANAGDAFQILADFPDDPHYYTFKNGFSTLPDALAAELERRHGDNVRVLLCADVDSVSRRAGGFRLDVTEAPEERDSRPSIPGGVRKRIEAETLIVAVAAKGAEDLFHRSPAFRDDPDAERLWNAIHSALGMKLMKINLYFDHAWWRDGESGRPPVQFGPNFSDLPVNAVYPFYALPEQERLLHGAAEDEGGPAALTIYCDFDKTNFWHGLQAGGPMFFSPLQEKESARRPQRIYGASVAVVDAAKAQFQKLFGVKDVPDPVLTSYRLWDGENDFEFAYHQWRMGVGDAAVRDYLSHPIEGVHFCNEAFSDMHGWVNGSLRSANLALAHFGLKPLDGAPCESPHDAPPASAAARRPGLWGG